MGERRCVRLSAPPLPPRPMQPLTVSISGMSCGHCVASVKSALDQIDGVRVEDVEIGRAVVAYDPAKTSAEKIGEAIADEGYAVTATS